MSFIDVDGQKIAIRLSRRITTVTKQLKKYLSNYNARCPIVSQLSWEEATNLPSHSGSHCLYTTSDVPNTVKFKAVRLSHQRARATEEITRLESEMRNCVDHFTSKYEYLTSKLRVLQESCGTYTYAMGSVSLLAQHIRQCEVQICRLRCFVSRIQLPQLEAIGSSEMSTHFPNLLKQNSLSREVPDISVAQTSIRDAEVEDILYLSDATGSSEEELETDCESGIYSLFTM